MKRNIIISLALAALILAAALPARAGDDPKNIGPVKGQITFIEFYADWCAPCVWMKPIIAQMKEKYGEVVAFQELDAWAHRKVAAEYGIQALPTQIVYDDRGNLIYRHEGFLSAVHIETLLGSLGVEATPAKKE